MPDAPQGAIDIQRNFDQDKNTDRYMRQIRHLMADHNDQAPPALHQQRETGMGGVDPADAHLQQGDIPMSSRDTMFGERGPAMPAWGGGGGGGTGGFGAGGGILGGAGEMEATLDQVRVLSCWSVF